MNAAAAAIDRFPDDFPIEALRGWRRPGWGRMLTSLGERIAWLSVRIKMRGKLGKPTAAEADELAALVIASEAAGYELRQLANAADAALAANAGRYRLLVARGIAASEAGDRRDSGER